MSTGHKRAIELLVERGPNSNAVENGGNRHHYIGLQYIILHTGPIKIGVTTIVSVIPIFLIIVILSFCLPKQSFG